MFILRGRVETESDGTRRSTGGEMKGKEANGVGSQHSCTVWEHGLSNITTADAHSSAASSRLNWHPRQYKWTRPFRWKTKSGFCTCAITFRFHSTADSPHAEQLYYIVYRCYLIRTPWSKILLEKLADPQLFKKFPGFHETLKFITTLTPAGHLFLP